MGLGGFFKGLLKVAPIAASFIPGVGPAIGAGLKGLTAGSLIKGGLDAAGAIAGGMEKGRTDQNAALFDRAGLEQRRAESHENALQNRADLDIRRRTYAHDAERTSLADALRSAYAKNVQDVSFTRPSGVPSGRMMGGARPSALGAEGRAAADLMHRKAMERAMNGEQFDPLPPIERVNIPMPRQAGFFENILGGAGAVGGAIRNAEADARAGEQSTLVRRLLDKMNEEQQPSVRPAPLTLDRSYALPR